MYFNVEADHFQPRLTCKKLSQNNGDFSVLIDDDVEFELKIETFTLAHGKDFIRMFALLLASFYIFNVEYPKKLEATMVFLQKYMLRIGDETKTPHKVLQYFAKIIKA